MRWLRGALVTATILLAACSDGDTKPVPSANLEESQRFCAALTATSSKGNKGTDELRKTVPDALKDDYDKWKVNNDPDKTHVNRLNEYTHKACGLPFDEPGFATTTTGATSTSATVAP